MSSEHNDQYPDDGEPMTLPMMSRESSPASLILRISDGREVPLDRDLQIGQSPKSDLVLKDPAVSRLHCKIELAGTRILIHDLQSTNGTFLNGTRIASAQLHAGSVLALGSTRIWVGAPGKRGVELVGTSPAMEEVRREIARFAPTSLPIMILGETGTGKELVALALHEQSGRKGPFVPVNCGSLARDLIESELFGHEKGAFTGAIAKRAGVFQEANNGTLFLDEVGELPIELQPRLLRVLETATVRPVGADREFKVDVRVVAATHVDLQTRVAKKKFRQDLYFRLAAAVIRTPALRDRTEDLIPLAEKFLADWASQGGMRELSKETRERLEKHAWPGNVRELRNVLQRAFALSGSVIEARDLDLDQDMSTTAVEESDRVVNLEGRSFTEIEKEVLMRTIRRFRGNKRKAADALGMAKSTLCDKAKRYGLVLPDEED